MTFSARISELGLTLPEVVVPVGTYVPATRLGNAVYTSGQLPMRDGQLLATGIVGQDVDIETAAKCARQATLNALAAAADAAGGIDQIVRVVRVVGYVASGPDFGSQPAVVNGGSDLLVEIFGDAGRHVRSAVGVASLPLGAPVEVELVVEVRD